MRPAPPPPASPTVVEAWAVVEVCELSCWGPGTVFRAWPCRLLAAYFEPQDTGKPQKKFLFLTLSCPFSLLLLPLLQGRHRILNPSLQAQLMKLRNRLLTTRVRAGWKGSLAYLDCLDQKTSAGGSVLHPVEGTPQRQAKTVWARTAEFPYPALLHQIISLARSSDLNMNVTSFPRVLCLGLPPEDSRTT